MNLQHPNQKNLIYIIDQIKESLKVVNAALISSDDFQLHQYEDLLEIWEMIQKKKGRLTMMEVDGILSELGDLRKANRK